MKEFPEHVLHRTIEEEKYKETDKLPPVLRIAFALRILKVEKQAFFLALPYEDMRLAELRKMHLQLERFTGENLKICSAPVFFTPAGIRSVYEEKQGLLYYGHSIRTILFRYHVKNPRNSIQEKIV